MFVVEYISQLIGQASRIADYFINVIMRMSENPKIDVALLDKILQLHNKSSVCMTIDKLRALH